MRETRINKYLAERLGVSRREADEMVRAGKVALNGKVAEIGNKINKGDKVVCDGKELPEQVDYIYYAFNKPVGFVCSRNQQGKDPTIYELLPKNMQSMKNVGRLDRESSGMMILTNDGDFGYQMTHPSFVKSKIYEVTLHKPLAPEDRAKITSEGVEIADGISRFEIEDNLNPPDDTPKRQLKAQRRAHQQAAVRQRAAALEAVKAAAQSGINTAELRAKNGAADEEEPEADGLHLIVTLTEGRNRQIRRTFSALGYNVLALHRTKFGDYELGDLQPGEYRQIEVEK